MPSTLHELRGVTDDLVAPDRLVEAMPVSEDAAGGYPAALKDDVHRARPPEILLVDDDPGAIQLMARILARVGHLRFATDGETALRLARETVPDLILLDAELPGMSGFEVCAELKADALLARTPVVFVTSHHQPDFEISGFSAGAADFISKPVSEALVLARVQRQLQVKRMQDELQRLATVDALTGVANRRKFDEVLAREWPRGLRDGRPMSLLMIDVDHFKRFNDCHGHPAGDAALQAVARVLQTGCRRPADLVARYGGEEFALLLPNTPREGAEHLAQELVQRMAALRLAHADSPTAAHVTISVGVGCVAAASLDRAGSCARPTVGLLSIEGLSSSILQAADEALYEAKRNGRARTACRDVADVRR